MTGNLHCNLIFLPFLLDCVIICIIYIRRLVVEMELNSRMEGNEEILDRIARKEKIHPYLSKLVKLVKSGKGKLSVDGFFDGKCPVLIVANHLSIEDIPTLMQALKEHFFVLVSDEDKNTLNGYFLEAFGVKWVSRLNKESRVEAKETIVEYLKNGARFAEYPESTWNLSPNLLMLPMNYGCIDMANIANVDILPVVSSFEDGKRNVKIGELFAPTENLKESIQKLRDNMATMVYEHLEEQYAESEKKRNVYTMMVDGEEYKYEKRDDIPSDYWDKYVSELYDQYDRAKKDKDGVREFESQFIFEPKDDAHRFFQIFNSVIVDNGQSVRRITSEADGYNQTEYSKFFGYGYNECNYKKVLKK